MRYTIKQKYIKMVKKNNFKNNYKKNLNNLKSKKKMFYPLS